MKQALAPLWTMDCEMEALWCLSQHRQHQIPARAVHVSSTSVQPVMTVQNLGVYLDADVTMYT